MRFFMMQQDKKLPDIIQFRDFDIRGPRHIFYKEEAVTVNEHTMMYLAEKSGETVPDIIQSPVHMISDTVKKVFDMYEDDMVFRTIVIADQKEDRMLKYHHLLLERLDVFSGQTEFYPEGSCKRLVLDAQKIGEHKVFMLNDKRFSHPFVSLEVVESLLRRQVMGICFQEVEVI